MENLYLYIVAAVIVVGGIIYAICTIGKVMKMSKEQRVEFVKSFLKGLIADAEAAYGAGHGAEKLASVEAAFAKKAPILYKIALKICGVDSLVDLIELGLFEIKNDFGK